MSDTTTSTEITSPQHLSLIGRSSLQRHEGVKNYYNDIAGNCTKGIGVLVHSGHCTREELTKVIPEKEKTKSFDACVEVAERAVYQQTRKQQLTQGQFDALVSFTYNVGAYGAKQVLAYVNAGKIKAAANEMQRYNKYTPLDKNGKPFLTKDGKKIRKVSQGLAKRRMEESSALLSTTLKACDVSSEK